MTNEEFIEKLKELNIILTQVQLNQLEKYYELLIEWNKKINLTRIVEKKDVYLKHFYDSITLIKAIDLSQTSLATYLIEGNLYSGSSEIKAECDFLKKNFFIINDERRITKIAKKYNDTVIKPE